jgi:hypothetical protein
MPHTKHLLFPKEIDEAAADLKARRTYIKVKAQKT